MRTDDVRGRILARTILGAGRQTPLPAPLAVVPAPEEDEAEQAERLLREIRALCGEARRIAGAAALRDALAALVVDEKISAAAVWDHPDLECWQIAETLRGLGVRVAATDAGKEEIAGCDLGVTRCDAAVPATGTLVMRSSPGQSPLVSLLPRLHLAIVRKVDLCRDVTAAFVRYKDERRLALITGPSRTSDIEKVLTIGVHGPRQMHVWYCEEGRGIPTAARRNEGPGICTATFV